MEKQEQQVKPIQRLNSILRVLLISLAGLTAVSIVSNIVVYYSYSQMLPETSYEGVFVPAEWATGVIAILYLIVLFTTFITFGMWIYRMNHNLRVQTDYPMEITPGWAIGWYFIPVANLVKPYQAMKEIYLASLNSEGASESPLKLWWGLWIVSNLVDNITLRAAPELITVQNAMDGMVLNGFAEVLNIALDIAALLLVTKIWQGYSVNFGDSSKLDDGAAIRPTAFG